MDYIPHHEPFQYYAATANPMHLPPTAIAMIGHQDRANHQYDTADFWVAADSGHLPQVSFLKAAARADQLHLLGESLQERLTRTHTPTAGAMPRLSACRWQRRGRRGTGS